MANIKSKSTEYSTRSPSLYRNTHHEYKLTHFLSIFFAEEIKTFSKINRNTYKPSVPEEVKDIVRRNFTRELEFYDFCKQRLHKQYLALNLDKKP